jgi:hypothetical protein
LDERRRPAQENFHFENTDRARQSSQLSRWIRGSFSTFHKVPDEIIFAFLAGISDDFKGSQFHRGSDGHRNILTVILDTHEHTLGALIPVE